MTDRAHFDEHLIAYIEGNLDAASASRVKLCIENDPVCRDEYDSMLALMRALENTGDAVAKHVAQTPIDILDAVMREVASKERAAERERFRQRSTAPVEPQRAPLWRMLAIAAGFTVVAALIWQTQRPTVPTGPQNPPVIAKAQTTSTPTTPNDDVEPKDPATAAPSAIMTMMAQLEERINKDARPAKEMAQTTAPELSSLTPQDVLSIRRLASVDPEAQAKLASLARLTETQARAIATKEDASPAALMAASRALPTDEGQALLLVAMGKYDAQVGAGTGSALNSDGTAPAPSDLTDPKQILAPESVDPAKEYQAALDSLASGDLTAALALLEEAGKLPYPPENAIESANERAAAYEALGTNPTAARLLAALTIGTDSYSALTDLGTELINAGNELAAQGDLVSAQRFYEAALEFGNQVETSNVANERLAGLDIQRQAIEVLEPTYTAAADSTAMESLTLEAEGLTVEVDEVAQLFSALNELLMTEVSDGLLNQLSDVILLYGDMRLFEFLN